MVDKEYTEYLKNLEMVDYCLGHVEKAVEILENAYNHMDFKTSRVYGTHIVMALDSVYDQYDFFREARFNLQSEHFKEVEQRRRRNKLHNEALERRKKKEEA